MEADENKHGDGEPDVVAHGALEWDAYEPKKRRATRHGDPEQREWHDGHASEVEGYVIQFLPWPAISMENMSAYYVHSCHICSSSRRPPRICDWEFNKQCELGDGVQSMNVCVSVCLSVCLREREREIWLCHDRSRTYLAGGGPEPWWCWVLLSMRVKAMLTILLKW